MAVFRHCSVFPSLIFNGMPPPLLIFTPNPDDNIGLGRPIGACRRDRVMSMDVFRHRSSRSDANKILSASTCICLWPFFGIVQSLLLCVCVCVWMGCCVRPGIQSEDQNQFFTFKVRTFWQSEVKISVLALWLCALSSLCHNMGVGGVWT